MKFDMNILLNKLASRKFWALLAGLIGAILISFNVDENSIAQITAIIGGFSSIVVYVLGESLIDQARAKNVQEVILVKEENK